jgi:SulP family sulfate permease
MTTQSVTSPTARGTAWHLFVPKLYTTLKHHYSVADLKHDAIAGLTVAIVALPLAMALAIASGATPEKGLITAVVAGFLISMLGGSRFQIGGPTGAFVVVVFGVIQQHGYDGLILATMMAGAMLILAGLLHLGTWIKYIPEPVVTGFTAGIAVIIFTSQIKDIFGLSLDQVPADFFEKVSALWSARDSINPANLAVAAGALALILGLRRYAPKLPGFLVAVVVGSVVTAMVGLPVETIGSKFGGISSSFPMPELPTVTLDRLWDLMPSAFTIAFLAGVESLLSAVVADSMTGRRHRSNCELVAQGVACSASALFGGLPATGAIARTVTNIRSGARSPIAGMLHAVFVLLFMLIFAPLADYIPLACLAAVLVIVAWNMSEIDRFLHLMIGPWGDRIVLLLTFGLTVAVDLTVAIEVGVVLGAILFMHRMAQVVAIISDGGGIIEDDIDDFDASTASDASQRSALPKGVEVFQLRGPLFFGVANRLADAIDSVAGSPRAFIVRMREVPMMDATGASKFADFVRKCSKHRTALIISGLQPQPESVLRQMRIIGEDSPIHLAADFAKAIDIARESSERVSSVIK